MKVSEVFKRQPKPKQERLVQEGAMGPLCYDNGVIHQKHDFPSPLSNYCQRCGLMAKDGKFTDLIGTSMKVEGASFSPPHPAQETPTSSTSRKSTAPAGASPAKDSASIGESRQQLLNL